MTRHNWLATTLAIALSACATTSAPDVEEAPPATPEPVAQAEPEKPLEYYLLVQEDFEDEAAESITEDNVDAEVDTLTAEISHENGGV